jgi:multiple sugar transport system substrate-binding protein
MSVPNGHVHRAWPIRLALIACLLLVSPAGCSRSRATPTPQPVTITFAHSNFDTDHYRRLVAQFQAEFPYITVEQRPVPYDSLFGNPGAVEADVFVAPGEALGRLLETGRVISLDPFLEQEDASDLADFYPGTLDQFAAEGKTWALPVGVMFSVMYFNRSLLDRYGVPHPQIDWTWDEFQAAVLAMSDPNAGIYGYAPDPNRTDPLVFVYQHGGRLFDDLRHPTRTTFDDPLTVEALEWYARLIHQYHAVPTPAEATAAFGAGNYTLVGYPLSRGVMLGKLGMWTGPFYLRQPLGETRGYVPLPRDARAATLATVFGAFMAAHTEDPDACWQWMSFLSRQLPPTWLPPARRSLVESPAYAQEALGVEVVQAVLAGDLLLTPNQPLSPEAGEAIQYLGEALEAILAGDSPPEQALSWAQGQSRLR